MRVAISVLLAAVLLPATSDAGLFNKETADEERAEIQQQRTEILSWLVSEKPEIESAIASSVGYAVFYNTGIKILVVSTGNGKGVAHDNASGEDIYMKMFSAGGGLGVGLKKFGLVFIFHEREAFDNFIETGWNFSGQAAAAATTDT